MTIDELLKSKFGKKFKIEREQMWNGPVLRMYGNHFIKIELGDEYSISETEYIGNAIRISTKNAIIYLAPGGGTHVSIST